ncbi:MAG: tyrosine-type recombinase/integrase [Alphaproteobacteria bacterium]|nr:tyrosine-type recombinase/integrase [Alphaproteobacteria bacterium]
MPNIRLSQHRVEALEARKSPYDVRDAELKGFGIRVLPSGAKRFFVHSQHEGRRVWKTVGDADCMELDEARRQAAEMLAAIRRDETPALPEDRLFEAVAGEVFDRYGRNWKPGTMKVNRNYLRSTILPRFGKRNIADITRQDVQNWFASLRATPVAADRSAPILSVIMRQAEIYGYRPEGSNPCAGIRRYRRRGRERFLSETELSRLGIVLDSHEPRHPRNVAFIRLLLLTGCRKSEIATLQWSDYREGRLFLRDGKTGPRTVWLSSPARAVLDGVPRQGEWVFPSARTREPVSSTVFEQFWRRVRKEAEIADARLHDLRHTYASIAVMQGETVTTTARLLGHNNAQTTLKYTHLSDRPVREATDALAAILGEG